MSLAKMIAAQKAAAEAKASCASATSGGPIPNSPAAGKPKLTFGIKPKASASPAVSQESTVDSKPAPASPAPAVASVSDPVVDSTVISLDDISDTTVEGLDSASSSDRGAFAFADEIPASAPVRDNTAELDAPMKAFVTQLDSIYEVVHDPELFGQMIRVIMQELQENPDYTKLMADQDVHTMIRGLRQSMGLAKVKKAEKATKARGSKKSPATSAVLSTAEELFNASDW